MGLISHLTSGPCKCILLGSTGSEAPLGETLAPLVVEKSVGEYVRVQSQQRKGTLRLEEGSGLQYMVETMLGENTIANLMRALGIKVTDSPTDFQLTEGSLPEQSLIALGPGTNKQVRLLRFPKAVAITTGGVLSWAQSQQNGTPIRFEVIESLGGNWGKVEEYAAVWNGPLAFDVAIASGVGTNLNPTATALTGAGLNYKYIGQLPAGMTAPVGGAATAAGAITGDPDDSTQGVYSGTLVTRNNAGKIDCVGVTITVP